MYIGITERGDAGVDFSWEEQIRQKKVDGAILITKKISDEFIQKVSDLYQNGFKIIVHCTVTGYGGTTLEPNVPTYKEQLNMLSRLTETFPKGNCVLRIDPIFPSTKGIKRVKEVVSYAASLGLLPMRMRVSILDEYKHVKDRLKACGLNPLYKDDFQANTSMITDVALCLVSLSDDYDISFETCAEEKLVNLTDEIEAGICKVQGCISKVDLDILGLELNSEEENIQKRKGCHCLSCKKELLQKREPCPNGCLYCYWKG